MDNDKRSRREIDMSWVRLIVSIVSLVMALAALLLKR